MLAINRAKGYTAGRGKILCLFGDFSALAIPPRPAGPPMTACPHCGHDPSLPAHFCPACLMPLTDRARGLARLACLVSDGLLDEVIHALRAGLADAAQEKHREIAVGEAAEPRRAEPFP
jgi:hypothetical protein